MKTPRLLLFVFGFFGLVLSGCETPQIKTATGNPEVTINKTETDGIKAQIVNQMINQGFTIKTDTPYNLQFTKQLSGVGGVMYQSLMGNANSSTPEVEIAFNIARLQDSTRVVATRAVVMQNAFGQVQRNTSPNPKDNAYLQTMLLNIKASVEGLISNTSTGPLYLRAGLENLPPVEVAQLKQFGSMAAANESAEKEAMGLVEIAVVTYPTLNESEEQLMEKLRNNAAQIGAEYLVISKSPEDLKTSLEKTGVSAKLVAVAFKIQPARVGVNYDAGLQKKGILVVKSFTPQSKAEVAGLHVGDTISKLDGINPANYAEYAKHVVKWTPGATIKVEFERDGKPGEVEVELVGPK